MPKHLTDEQAVNRSHSHNETDLAGCVWWSIRHGSAFATDPDAHMAYVEHVCRNRKVLAR